MGGHWNCCEREFTNMNPRTNRKTKHAFGRLAIVTALLAVWSANTHAYLDPGSGSMLLQVILGGFAAVGVALKLYWHRIKAALGFGKNPETAD